MRFFAITPDGATTGDILAQYEHLNTMDVSCLYFRDPALYEKDPGVLQACIESGIVPFVHHHHWRPFMPPEVGMHFKEGESLREDAFSLKGRMVSASTHSVEEALKRLKEGCHFIFLSPIFHALSKQDERPLLELETVQSVLKEGGERVVLLGGMTQERITALKNTLSYDFSVGGISLFFWRCLDGHS